MSHHISIGQHWPSLKSCFSIRYSLISYLETGHFICWVWGKGLTTPTFSLSPFFGKQPVQQKHASASSAFLSRIKEPAKDRTFVPCIGRQILLFFKNLGGGDNCFTILYWFLPYIMNQLQVYICLLSLEPLYLPPHPILLGSYRALG